LGLISETELESKKRYRHFLRRGSKLKADHVLEHEDAIDRFKSNLNAKFPSIFNKVEKTRQVAIASGLNLLGPKELDRMIAQMRKEPFPNQPEGRKAKKYIIEQLIARGYKREEIAVKLGLSRKTVYNLLKSLL
jgi:putative transposase